MTRPIAATVVGAVSLALLSIAALPDAGGAPSGEDGASQYRLSRDEHARAVAYSRSRYRLYFFGAAYGIVILAGLIAAGVAPALRDVALAASPRAWVQAIVYVPPLLAILAVSGLPLEVQHHRLELEYAQSIQGWASWFADWLKGQALALAIGTFMVWLLYAIVRGSPERWWLWFWVAAQPIIVFLLFLEPIVIAPLFFRFEPLEAAAPALVQDIEKVIHRADLDIPRSRMFEMKASEKLRTVNAYVAGIGASKRVVVWDTTIEKLSREQTLFVFGHELGHYVLGHIPRLIAASAAGLFVFLFVGALAADWLLARYGIPWGMRGLDDWASLPVLLLLFSVFGFFASPIANAYSRSLERQADEYGLGVIDGVVADPPAAAASAFQALGEIVLADPDPPLLAKLWLFSHPPIAERIRFARSWHATAAASGERAAPTR
ncbi:MAG: hypothetical protein QOD06_1591 [Candidatus Binatota bacterium]|jgi:Zn-dependent protease with chaperone function|nr:hypothetical protein [Candidatus Binatota bacterium]